MHKKSVDGCLSFRPVLCASQTAADNLGKYLVSILKLFLKLITNTQSK